MKIHSFSAQLKKALNFANSRRRFSTLQQNIILPSPTCNLTIPGVTIVRTPAEARRVVDIVKKVSQIRNTEIESRSKYHSTNRFSSSQPLVHAWDTEVVNLNLEVQSPVGHGKVICASFYSGPEIDYGTGATVWIDSLSDPNTLLEFKSVLEDTTIRKVWHNYGFDRHVLMNSGIDAKGFFGDTMHLARLCDTSLKKSGGYKKVCFNSSSSFNLIVKPIFFKILIVL